MDQRANSVALKTIVAKEVRRFLRIWVQTLMPPIISLSLYFVIFGSLIGSQISRIHGFTYMQFIVPGLIMMAIITNSYMNVSSSFFSSKFQKSVEELLVSPTPNSIIIFGYVFGGMARGLSVGLLVSCVAYFFAEINIYQPSILFLFAILTSAFFAQAGLTNAIFAKKFDDISIIPSFVLTPLTYLGGVFYSIEQLTGVWKSLSQLNPILYMVNGFRYGFLGISDIFLPFAIGMILSLNILFYLINYFLLKRGIGLRS